MKYAIFYVILILIVQKLYSNPINDTFRVNIAEKPLSSVVYKNIIDSLKNVFTDLRKAVEITQNDVLRIDSINKAQNQIIAQDKFTISEISDSQKRQNSRSLYGAIILLLGLFLEIMGAVLVASESLSKPTYKMRPFKTTEYSIGHLGGNQNLDIKIISLQVIGTYLLILGFTLQFIGTVLVISANMIVNGVLIIYTLTAVSLLSFILINKIGGLNVKEKIRLSILNIKGLIKFSLEERLHKKNILICESCFKNIKADSAYIGYLSNNNPFDTPRKFFIGHETCIAKEFEINIKNPSAQFSIQIEKLDTFFINDFKNVTDISEREFNKSPNWDSEIMNTVSRLKTIKGKIRFDKKRS